MYQYFAFQGSPKFTQIWIFGSKINHLGTIWISTFWRSATLVVDETTRHRSVTFHCDDRLTRRQGVTALRMSRRKVVPKLWRPGRKNLVVLGQTRVFRNRDRKSISGAGNGDGVDADAGQTLLLAVSGLPRVRRGWGRHELWTPDSPGPGRCSSV
jgi:hypothetical protein